MYLTNYIKTDDYRLGVPNKLANECIKRLITVHLHRQKEKKHK